MSSMHIETRRTRHTVETLCGRAAYAFWTAGMNKRESESVFRRWLAGKCSDSCCKACAKVLAKRDRELRCKARRWFKQRRP